MRLEILASLLIISIFFLGCAKDGSGNADISTNITNNTEPALNTSNDSSGLIVYNEPPVGLDVRNATEQTNSNLTPASNRTDPRLVPTYYRGVPVYNFDARYNPDSMNIGSLNETAYFNLHVGESLYLGGYRLELVQTLGGFAPAGPFIIDNKSKKLDGAAAIAQICSEKEKIADNYISVVYAYSLSDDLYWGYEHKNSTLNEAVYANAFAERSYPSRNETGAYCVAFMLANFTDGSSAHATMRTENRSYLLSPFIVSDEDVLASKYAIVKIDPLPN